jgi:fatty acid desaturase
MANYERYLLGGDVSAVTSVAADGFEEEVEGQWFSATVDRKRLKQLMARSDVAGWRHFGPWLVLLIGSGVGIIATWWSWWTVPLLVVYGLMYAMSDHHAHELSHGTPFRTRWINEALYRLNGFMTLHEVHYWRWSHTRHHTHTLLVGRDPEIALKRPPNMVEMWLNFFFLPGGIGQIRSIVAIAVTGRIAGDGMHFIPPAERRKAVRNSRIYVAIFVAAIVGCVVWTTVLPAVLVVTPRFWGGPFAQAFNAPQHAGLPEDVLDHRLNCRTMLMNPLFEFLYMKMNYHVEHHMFPMVPFSALPQLHAEIADQCVPASPSLLAAWRESLPALRRQRVDPSYAIDRVLPRSPAS